MLPKLSEIIDRFTRFFGAIADWLSLALVFLILEQVIARYLFDSSSVALQELQWHVFGLILLLSMARTFAIDQHVRVDIISGKLSRKRRALIDLAGIILLLLPMCGILIYYGFTFAAAALTYQNPYPADHWSRAVFDADGAAYRIWAPLEGFFRETVLQGEVSANPGGLEGRWLIKAAIPFGFLLLFLQSVSEAGKRLRLLISADGDRRSD